MGKKKNKGNDEFDQIPLVDDLNYDSHQITKYLEIVNGKFVKFNYHLEYGDTEFPNNIQLAEVVKKSYFNPKQFVNSVKYINYFLTFFDEDKELLHIYLLLMTNITATNAYENVLDFLDDLEAKAVTETLVQKIINMVEYNTPPEIVQENKREYDESLQLTATHLRAIMGMGVYHKMMIPIVSKMVTSNKNLILNPKTGVRDLKNFYFYTMSRFVDIFDEHYDIVLRNKLFNTSSSRVGKTEHPQKIMWERKSNTGVNTVTFTNQLLKNIIIDISQKSIFQKSVVIYIHVCLDKNIRHSLQDDQDKNEFGSMEMRTSDATEDSLSRYDKFQINSSKVSETYINRSEAIIKDTIKRLCEEYDIKIDPAEEEFYCTMMGTHDIQISLLNQFYAKYFDSYDDFKLVKIQEIPKLTIIMKKVLQVQQFHYLAEIISGRLLVTKAKRMNIKKVESLIKENPKWEEIQEKYSDIREHINTQELYTKIAVLLSVPILKIDYDEYRRIEGGCDFDEETHMYTLCKNKPSNNFVEMSFNPKILIDELLRFIL